MAQELDVDADPFLQLLSDACAPARAALNGIRRSPASAEPAADPAADGAGERREYEMLIAAREHLESGKEYRSVRAGPGFTRKLMEGIDQQGRGEQRRGLPITTLIALASALVIGAVLVVAAIVFYPRTPAEPGKSTVEDLLRVRRELLNETAVARFDAQSSGLPDGWRRIGGLSLETAKGLRPSSNVPASGPSDAPAGGGVVAVSAVGANEPFAAEALLRLGKSSEDTLFEFFVSTDPDFSQDRAKSANDLVWLVQGARQKVLLSGREQANKPRPEPAKDPAKPDAGEEDVAVRILMNHDSAVIECGDQAVWSGPHGLPAAPRYVGVRFLRTGDKAHDPVTVLELRVRKK